LQANFSSGEAFRTLANVLKEQVNAINQFATLRTLLLELRQHGGVHTAPLP
jgi:hypothetical protein